MATVRWWRCAGGCGGFGCSLGGSFTGFFLVAALFLEGGDVGEEEFADVGDAEGGAFFQRVLGDGGVELVEEVEVAVEAFGDEFPKVAVEHGLEFFLGGGAGGLGADPFQVGGGDGVVAVGIGDGGGVEAGAGRKSCRRGSSGRRLFG